MRATSSIQRIVLLEVRDDVLAAGRGITADDVADALPEQGCAQLWIARRIASNGFEADARLTGLADFRECQHRAIVH
jgi:hypothetical protein